MSLPEALLDRAIRERREAIEARDRAVARLATLRAAADDFLDHLDEKHETESCAEADAFRAELAQPDR